MPSKPPPDLGVYSKDSGARLSVCETCYGTVVWNKTLWAHVPTGGAKKMAPHFVTVLSESLEKMIEGEEPDARAQSSDLI